MSLRLIKYFRFPSFTGTDWTGRNPLLERGEIGYQLDSAGTEIIGAKVGPGLWNSLGYFGQKLIPKTLRLNVTGAAASASGVGFEIEEGGSVTGYLKTNSARTGFLFNAPSGTYDAEFLLSSLSANRTYTLPNQSGTIALIENIVSNSLTNGRIWIGNASNVATEVTMSGDATITNAGVVTVGPLSLTTKVTGILPVANGGTGTSSVFTSGRVIFAGASGVYTTNSSINWDNTAKKLIIGTSQPMDIYTPISATGNMFAGYQVGNTTVSGNDNIIFGKDAGSGLTSGFSNALFGNSAGGALTSGGENSFFGPLAGWSTTTADGNVAIGSGALSANITGAYNTAIGYNAGAVFGGSSTDLTFPSYSIFIGAASEASADGVAKEIVIGVQAVGNGSNTVTIGDSANTANYLTGALKLQTTPTNDATVTKLLTYDSVTKEVKYRDASTIVASGSGHVIYNGASALTQRANLTFTNGLTAADNATETLAKLGGELTEDTNITGSSYYLNFNPGNVSLFGSSPTFGSGTGVMYIGVATTPPSSAPTSGVYMWVESVAGNYELRIMDSAGNIKGLS